MQFGFLSAFAPYLCVWIWAVGKKKMLETKLNGNCCIYVLGGRVS